MSSNPINDERLVLQKANLLLSEPALLVSKARMLVRGAGSQALGAIGNSRGGALLLSSAACAGTDYQMLQRLASIGTQQTAWASINQLETVLKTIGGAEGKKIAAQIQQQLQIITESKQMAYQAREAYRTTLPGIMKLVRDIQNLSF